MYGRTRTHDLAAENGVFIHVMQYIFLTLTQYLYQLDINFLCYTYASTLKTQIEHVEYKNIVLSYGNASQQK